MAKFKLLTSAMAAKILGFTPDYVRKLCSAGKIKAEKLGHDWLLNAREIQNIKRQRKAKGDKENDQTD